jgi:glutamine cyclotransferase
LGLYRFFLPNAEKKRVTIQKQQ